MKLIDLIFLATMLLLTYLTFRRARLGRVRECGPLLRRARLPDIDLAEGPFQRSRYVKQFAYWCHCGQPLTDGPRGGLSVNAVCVPCRINYGELEGYWGGCDQPPVLPIEPRVSIPSPTIHHRIIGS